MNLKRIALMLALAGAVNAAAAATPGAAPVAVVEGVQMPAWLERGGVRQPIAPGMELRESDRIFTGDHARILVALPEGSKVKLGENAQLTLDAFKANRQDQGVFMKSALNVVKGAFRFTTSALDKLRSRREVDIRFATITAGIRGTDVWGKQAGDREIVCLIEGKVEVARELGGVKSAPVTMDQPLQFYIAPKDKPSLPVAAVSPEQLKQWSEETEIGTGTGAATRGGKWKVTFASPAEESDALKLYETLRNQGYPAQIFPDKAGDSRIYHVQVSSLSSEAEARALASRLGPAMNLQPRVSR